MALPEPKNRELVLSDNIDHGSVRDIINSILAINGDDSEKEKDYKNWERKPIKLFINSFGGSVYDGLALVDIIKYSKTPVHTICIGSAMSMGLWIWLSGHRRIMGKHGTLMFHDISSWIADKTSGVKQELDEMIRLQGMLIEEIVTHSKITKIQLQDYIDRKAEWYISAQDAIIFELADGVLGEDE